MGSSTDFTGAVNVTPPLNAAEIEYLRLFAATRHVDDRPEGDYYVDGMSNIGKRIAGPGLPRGYLYCGWIVVPDGSGIQWDDDPENNYESPFWMQWIIDHFLGPDAHAQGVVGFEEFTFDHHVNGCINVVDWGPDDEDFDWELVVDDNKVTVLGKSVYELAVGVYESVPSPDESVLNVYAHAYDWERSQPSRYHVMYYKDQKSIKTEFSSAGQLIALNYKFGDGRYFAVSLEAATKLGLEMKFIAKQWVTGRDVPDPPLPLTGPLAGSKQAVYIKGPNGWKNRDDDQEELSEALVQILEARRAMGLD